MDRVDQITTFVRVVELGGFAAAARDLGAAPSAVTTHIQALEQRLWARLLNRNTRHVKPTEVGEAYYEHCVDVLSHPLVCISKSFGEIRRCNWRVT